jgi:hypothetical protein
LAIFSGDKVVSKLKGIATFALFALLGCTDDPKEIINPPLYGRGDVVSVIADKPSSLPVVGIILESIQYEDNVTYQLQWRYSIMFREHNMSYDELNVKLIERFDWNRPQHKQSPLQPQVQAEVTGP